VRPEEQPRGRFRAETFGSRMSKVAELRLRRKTQPDPSGRVGFQEADVQPLPLTGRQRAQRDGNRTAQLFGALSSPLLPALLLHSRGFSA